MNAKKKDYLITVCHGRVRHVQKQVLLWRKRMRARVDKEGTAREERAKKKPAVKRNFFGDDEG